MSVLGPKAEFSLNTSRCPVYNSKADMMRFISPKHDGPDLCLVPGTDRIRQPPSAKR